MDILGVVGWEGAFAKHDDLVLVGRYLGTVPYENDAAGLVGFNPRYGFKTTGGFSMGVSSLFIYGQLRNESGFVPRAGLYATYGGTKGLFVFWQAVLGQDDMLSALYVGQVKTLRDIYGFFLASEIASIVSSKPSVKRNWLVEGRFHLGPHFAMRYLQLMTGISVTIRLTQGDDFSNAGLFFRVAY